jgi:hypothetical protein
LRASYPRIGGVRPEATVELYVPLNPPEVRVYDLNASGDAAAKRTITFNPDTLSYALITDVALDNARNLYLCVPEDNKVLVYGPDADGTAVPIRVIAGDQIHLGARSVALDSAGNLYSANGDGSVTVYPPDANGNAAPVRIITDLRTEPGGFRHEIAIDSQDYLYYSQSPNSSISVYAPGAWGAAPPVRRIQGPRTGLQGPSEMDFDAEDNLYVANGVNVLVFGPWANGNAAPIRVISGDRTGFRSAPTLAVDPAGMLFVGAWEIDSVADHVNVFAAGADGNTPPVRTIIGFPGFTSVRTMAIDKPRTPPTQLRLTLPGSVDRVIGRAPVDGKGWIWRPGRPPIPIPGPGEWAPMPADTRDAIIGLVLDDLASLIPDAETRTNVRIELLNGVLANVDRLRRSTKEGQDAHPTAPRGRVVGSC